MVYCAGNSGRARTRCRRRRLVVKPRRRLAQRKALKETLQPKPMAELAQSFERLGVEHDTVDLERLERRHPAHARLRELVDLEQRLRSAALFTRDPWAWRLTDTACTAVYAERLRLGL